MEFEKICKPQFNECFICGSDNPIGLHLNILSGEDTAVCDWVAMKEYEGYAGMLHGGILAAIMDDMMAHALYSRNIAIVTAHLGVDYKSTVYTGDKIHIEVHLDSHREGSKAYHMTGTVTKDGILCAELHGVAVQTDKVPN